MIYRIEVRTQNPHDKHNPALKKFYGAWFGAAAEQGDINSIRRYNDKAVCWYTEAGWKKYGREAIKSLHNRPEEEKQWFEPLTVRVLKDKNPAPSRIIWRDKYQLLLLPKFRSNKKGCF